MSRFFQGGVSDSDYSSSEEELLSSSDEELLNSSEEEEEQEQEDLSDDSEFANNDDDGSDSDSDDGGARGPSYFLKRSFAKDESDDESSDEDDKKVVKSAREKLLDEIEDSIAVIDNSKVLNDWVVALSEFDKLNRLLIKASQQNITTPSIYIKSLAGLDETLNGSSVEEKDSKKKLNASVAKAFNTIKQRVKKVAREHSNLIESFRASPDTFERDQYAQKDATESPAPTPATGKKSSNSALIFSTLRSITESRGKKNVDISEQIKSLEELVKLASTPYEKIVIYLILVPLRFDTATHSSFWPIEQWKAASEDVNDLFLILEQNITTYRVLETAEPLDDVEVEPTPNSDGVRTILGSVVSFVERLDDEFTRSLQVIDPYTTEYVERLRDEQSIYDTIIRAQLYTERVIPQKALSKIKEAAAESEVVISGRDQISRIVLRRIEHIYFKSSSLITTAEKLSFSNLNSVGYTSVIAAFSESKDYSDSLLSSLVSVLYNQSNSIYRKRAVLSHVYYYAHNNQYYKARDSLLISHLQSTIHNSEPGLQILFNRALVQLGLCAFRNGLIQEAQQALQEIATSQRHKELLGQSGQKFNNQSSIIDKQRLLPFHTHINLELLESVFLTSSLLIEIPQYAQLGSSIDAKKRLQNKSFRRTLEFHERQPFQGPPENTKDYIMHAAKALQAGNWKKAVELLNSIKVWNAFPESDKLRESIKEKIQIEGLRTYLFQFKSFYSKLSITKLSQIFELPESKVSATVSKMIFHQEIDAGLDQVSNSIIFTKSSELTKLQDLALTLADRASTLSDRNERLAGSHQGNERHSYSSSNNNQNQNRHQHRNANVKFAPVTGALSSAPGTISGALNGMDQKKRRAART